MKSKYPPYVLAAPIFAVLAFGACERKTTVVVSETPSVDVQPVAKTKTFETARLEATIDTFEREPTAVHNADVKKAFAELDGEIAELQERVAKTSGADRDEAALKLKNLDNYRAAQMVRFTKIQAVGGADTSSADGRSAGQKFEDGAKKVGNSIEDAGKKTGEAIKDLAN